MLRGSSDDSDWSARLLVLLVYIRFMYFMNDESRGGGKVKGTEQTGSKEIQTTYHQEIYKINRKGGLGIGMVV